MNQKMPRKPWDNFWVMWRQSLEHHAQHSQSPHWNVYVWPTNFLFLETSIQSSNMQELPFSISIFITSPSSDCSCQISPFWKITHMFIKSILSDNRKSLKIKHTQSSLCVPRSTSQMFYSNRTYPTQRFAAPSNRVSKSIWFKNVGRKYPHYLPAGKEGFGLHRV